MIFAAGLGTRLRPLTNNKPKALVEVNGVPLITHNINRLKQQGIDTFVVNVHHFGDLLIDYLNVEHRNDNIIISDERDALLDTGGGLFHAQKNLKGDEPFLVYNVDIISDIDIKAMHDYHQKNKALVTMAVRNRKTSRYLIFNDDLELNGWINKNTGEQIDVGGNSNVDYEYAFSGIQIVWPNLFDIIEKEGKFPIIPLYLDLAYHYPICAYVDKSEHWVDCGKVESLEVAGKILKNG